MAKQVINISAPNDHLGDPLRTAFDKTNDNFTELYDQTTVMQTQVTARQYFDYDYYIENVSGTYYARPNPNGSLTAYSGAVASTVINNAITALNVAGGGIIHVAKGTYTITAALLFSDVSDIHFVGEGYDNTIFTSAGVGTNYWIIDLRGNINNLEIAKIKFMSTANDAAPPATHGLIYGGLHTGGGNDMIVNGLHIHHCEFTCTDVNINGLFISTTEANSRLNRFNFEYNYLHDIGRIGIELYADAGVTIKNNSNKLTNNIFTATGTQGSYGMAISFVAGSQYAEISDNIIYETRKNQAIELFNATDAIIARNKISNSTYHIVGITTSGGVAYANPCKNIAIVNNVIDLVDPDAPGTKNTTVESLMLGGTNYMTISGNVLKGSLVSMIGCTYVNMTGNTIIPQGYYGIQLQDDTQFCKIADNLIDCDSSTFFPTVALSCTGSDCAYNEFTNNKIKFTIAETEPFYNASSAHDNICTLKQPITVTTSATTCFPGLPPGDHFANVLSYAVDRYVNLPTASASIVGTVIKGYAGGDEAFELRVAAAQAATVYINGVTTNVEALIPYQYYWEAVLIDATHWILHVWDANGVVSQPVPDAV